MNITKLFNYIVFYKKKYAKEKHMPIKSDILIVYIHILLSWNNFHIAEIPEARPFAVEMWFCFFSFEINITEYWRTRSYSQQRMSFYMYICIHTSTYNSSVIRDVLYWSLGTRGRNSDYCANVFQHNGNQFWHARVLTLTDRSPLSVHTCPHSASSSQSLGKSVILVFEKRQLHCMTVIELYR